ncbi:uncharacterized protein LOC115727353 isoform X1 [Rhodamnia argentea]|uniref:Uncharacterized protein LOC115727353 isoform X1 n=1 Tax=Rhodamnia argentea TaxID=178133 RepID=A0A8B8MTM0_9MYRT|nr:uncharacterized protein LOC115727353 isoform X1 [Rhodamnia argentea]
MMLGVNCRTSSSSFLSPSHLSSPSAGENGLYRNILNASPRLFSTSNFIMQLERTSAEQTSIYQDAEKIVNCDSVQYIPSNGTPSHKSTVELQKEIATLEVEIMHLESHLLSLYRTAFREHTSTLAKVSETKLQSKTRSPSRKVPSGLKQRAEPHVRRNGLLRSFQSSPAHCWASSDNQSCTSSSKAISVRDHKNADFGHRSLADHLGAKDISLKTPERLSEDIVRCISSIYCKLADPTHIQIGSSASPTSSLSSSSIFSSHNHRDSWSPSRNEEISVHQLRGLREESGRYGDMVEVLKICLDDNSFKFAATMLQKFRSLVRCLEDIDPRKMKREEKLAFWINIHNALVMHAYLAYGTGGRVKSPTIMKAAYNVGGHCINAYIIQSAILGCRSSHSAPWLQTLFTPGRKYKPGISGHLYALEYPEQLVHFALCSGAYSDPPVRVYTAKSIFLDLKLAKEDFIQANVYIHKESKIFLPRILYYFAKDMSLTMPGLLDVVKECLSEGQQQTIQKCMKGRLDKYVNWMPHNSTFRYVIHRELAGGRVAM